MSTASLSTPPTASLLAELDAAQRLVADHEVPPHVAAVHLRSVWLRLAEADDDPERGHVMAHELVEAQADPSLRDGQRRVADWLFERDEASADSPERADLLVHIALVREAVNPRHEGRDPVLAWGLGFLALVVLALVGFGVYGLVRGATGPWHVEWFPERDFSGQSRTDYVRLIDFDWGKGSPTRGIPVDDWSARFQTCLELDDETKIRFKLTSDDGSRLFIDGERVVDNWGDHSPRSRTGVRTLDAGVYHLRIDYYEARHGAKLVLEVAFDDDDFGPLSMTKIRQPSSDPDAPCE